MVELSSWAPGHTGGRTGEGAAIGAKGDVAHRNMLRVSRRVCVSDSTADSRRAVDLRTT